MFKKKPQIKALAPLRSSDRRKLADQIIKAFQLNDTTLPEIVSPTPDNENQDAKSANSKQSELRNALFPENIQSARFTTTQGQNEAMKQVSGMIYVGTHHKHHHMGEDGRVLWFKIDDRLYPSVYTLWHNASLLPLINTPRVVVEKLQSGADLMTPGLAGPPFPERAIKGSLVSIAALDAPSVPLSIGECMIDIASLETTQGAKGKAVEVIHCVGDELWSFSVSGKGGRQPPTEILEEVQVDEVDVKTTKNLEKMTLQDDEDTDGGIALDDFVLVDKPHMNASVDSKDTTLTDGGTQVEDTSVGDESSTPSKIYTAKELDDIFRNAFLYGVQHHKQTNPSAIHHGLDFPLSQSHVMSNLVQPFLPIFSPEDGKQMQIRNTTYKNMKKFLKALDKRQLLKVKEKPTEIIVLDIDFNDDAIKSFTPYPLPSRSSNGSKNGKQSEVSTPTATESDDTIGQSLSVEILYKVAERLNFLFSPAPTSSYIPLSEIKSALSTYINNNALTNETNKRLINLNDDLSRYVFTGTKPFDDEVISKGIVSKSAFEERVYTECSIYHIIRRQSPSFSSSSSQDPKPRAGQAPKVKITLETRSGNKTVTKISGLERYFVSPTPLADELRKTCAGSTSVEPLVGSSPKDALMEVMVQGPQKDAVLKALEKRGVKNNWVEIIDRVKKKK